MVRVMLALLLVLAPQFAAAREPGLRVEIEGIEGEALDNARALMTLVQQRHSEDLTGFRIRRYHERAATEIRTALEPFGYYSVQVDGRLEKTEQGWVARYRVDPGPRTRIRDLDLALEGEGAGDLQLQAAVGEFPLREGDPLLHARYEQGKRQLLQRALAAGYLDAHFSHHRLEVNAAQAAAGVELRLETGMRYELGEVSFRGADLDETLLQAYVPFRAGSDYSSRQLLDLQRGLEDSDYFAQVQVDADRARAEGRRIPVTVELVPHRPNKYTAGLGFGTDTGPRGRLGWANRRLNRAGHQASLEYRVSEIYEDYTGRYRIPLARPRTDFLEFTGLVGSEDIDGVESRRRQLGVSHSAVRGAWRRVLSLTFQQEDFEIGLTEGDTALFMPGINLQRVWGRERLVAERGARLQLDLKGAQEGLLSDTSFLQGRLDAKWIQPLGPDYRLITRGSLGGIQTDDFAALPPSIRFFAGGDNSVRGYDYHKLGPRDASGEVVGARHLVVGSVELERRIHGNWRAAVFLDTGNAVDSLDDPLKQGVGFGVRWETPIGLVRVDVASAVSEDGSPWRLHLTVGPDL